MASVLEYDDDRHRTGVIALWRDVFGYATAHNDPALALQRKRAVADGLLFVAEDDAGAVAGTAMAGYDGHRGWLYSVAVRPDLRGHGLGTTLVRRAEAALSALGCLKINLQLLATNEATAAFYRRLGYAAEPRVSMGRVLAENVAVPDAAASPEAVVREFWRRMARNDFHAVRPLLGDDFVAEWPQSRERIRGGERFARMNADYPAHGPWRFQVNRLVAAGAQVVTQVSVTDGVQAAEPVSFFEVHGGLVRRLTEYWPDPFEPASNRRHLVEPMDAPARPGGD